MLPQLPVPHGRGADFARLATVLAHCYLPLAELEAEIAQREARQQLDRLAAELVAPLPAMQFAVATEATGLRGRDLHFEAHNLPDGSPTPASQVLNKSPRRRADNERKARSTARRPAPLHPHPCSVCTHVFPTPSKVTFHEVLSTFSMTPLQLTRHMAKHTGSRNHVCGVCGAAYSQREGVTLHQSRAHKKPSLVTAE